MDNTNGMDMLARDQNAESEGPAVGVHGMLIVGEETIDVSHLPTWMAPHNFQVILEVTFRGTDQPQARYVNDRKTTGTRLYTSQPEEFDVRELAPTATQGLPSRSSFAEDRHLFRDDHLQWSMDATPHPGETTGQRHRQPGGNRGRSDRFGR